MSIAENVKRFREDAGLSQKELARQAGISQQLVSQLESGANQSTKHLPAIARVLGKTLIDFDPNLADVLAASGDDFPARYAELLPEEKFAVQALIEKFERGRATVRPSAEELQPAPRREGA